ncbi:MAG: single-stranded DNA-binding protein [Bacteroidales bacterium]|jgi:single-strand DNA-binding protein|nr:single-stranded DNA-binding protein [Bacteroidales bacterium]
MVNKVILLGRVGKDPEVRHLDSNSSVANFTLATNEYYVKDGARVEQTEWHNIVAWQSSAKYVEDYVRKGMLLYVEGRLRTRSWDDKDGNKRYTTEILSNSIFILTPKSNSQNSASQPAAVPEPESTSIGSATPADDLPF